MKKPIMQYSFELRENDEVNSVIDWNFDKIDDKQKSLALDNFSKALAALQTATLMHSIRYSISKAGLVKNDQGTAIALLDQLDRHMNFLLSQMGHSGGQQKSGPIFSATDAFNLGDR